MKPHVFLDSTFTVGTFHAALQMFLVERREECSPAHVFHLYRSLRPLGEWLGNPPLAAVSRLDLRQYVDSLWLRYSAGTIRPVVGDIRQFFKWSKKRRLVQKNPAKSLRKPRPRHRRDKAAPEAAVRQLMDHLSGKLKHLIYRDVFGVLRAGPANCWGYFDVTAIRDLLMLVFLYETGARAGELCRLGSRAMHQSCNDDGPVYEVISVGKTGDRVLRFTMATAELWHLWSAVRPSGCDEYALVSWRRGERPRPLTTNTISQILVRRCRAAGVRPFRAHALRHAKVRRGRKTVGVELTSRLMEHSSIGVTLGYANIADDELQEATLKTGLAYRLF